MHRDGVGGRAADEGIPCQREGSAGVDGLGGGVIVHLGRVRNRVDRQICRNILARRPAHLERIAARRIERVQLLLIIRSINEEILAGIKKRRHRLRRATRNGQCHACRGAVRRQVHSRKESVRILRLIGNGRRCARLNECCGFEQAKRGERAIADSAGTLIRRAAANRRRREGSKFSLRQHVVRQIREVEQNPVNRGAGWKIPRIGAGQCLLVGAPTVTELAGIETAPAGVPENRLRRQHLFAERENHFGIKRHAGGSFRRRRRNQ